MNVSSCIVVGSWKLGCNEWWGGWGIYSPNHQKWPLGGCLFDGAPDSPVPPPRHHCRWILTVGASDLWARLGVRCTPDKYCLLSGVPAEQRLLRAQWSSATAFNALQCARESEHAQLAHRTVYRTCPVHHRIAQRPHKSELQRSNPNGWLTWLAHRTVRCAMRQHTSNGHFWWLGL